MKYYLNLNLEDIPTEEWRTVAGFEVYQISSFGRVKRVIGQTHILRQMIHRGYCNVMLSMNNIQKTFRVHRIQAIAFHPKIEGKPYVNHKDGIRDHNHISNTEWCNNSENQRHAYSVLNRRPSQAMLGKTGALCPNSRHVNQYSLAGEFIKQWPAASEAARQIGSHQATISYCCNGRYKTAAGYKWKYAE